MGKTIFKKNPIREMIIQVSFPIVFEIENESPTLFQQRIFEDFPVAQLSYDSQQDIVLPRKADQKPTITERSISKNYSFVSANGTSKINLTKSFLSYSTLVYSRWEEVSGIFLKVFDIFREVYSPITINRVGIRYINAFSKSKLGLQNFKWGDLINEVWMGPYNLYKEENIKNYGTDIMFALERGECFAKIHSGLGMYSGESEISFIADADFMRIGNTDLSEIKDVLNYLHDSEHDFIFGVLKQPLFHAMEPFEGCP